MTTTSRPGRLPLEEAEETLELLTGALVQSVFARFASDYRRHLDQGRPPFDPIAWYRVEPGPAWTALVSITLTVNQPVAGLQEYLSTLVSDFAVSSEGRLSFQTALRLTEDLDEDHLRETGWKSINLRNQWPEAFFRVADWGEQVSLDVAAR